MQKILNPKIEDLCGAYWTRTSGLASLGQVRNSRLAALPLAVLLCSLRFHLAASATGGASVSRPIDAPGTSMEHTGFMPQKTTKEKTSRFGEVFFVVLTGLEPVTPSM